MRLKVTFSDARGNTIETFTADFREAMKKIKDFVRLHGTDPEEGGRGADAGTVYFEPAD